MYVCIQVYRPVDTAALQAAELINDKQLLRSDVHTFGDPRLARVCSVPVVWRAYGRVPRAVLSLSISLARSHSLSPSLSPSPSLSLSLSLSLALALSLALSLSRSLSRSLSL